MFSSSGTRATTGEDIPYSIDNTVYHLSRPLISFLNTTAGSDLDINSERCLRDINSYIESILDSHTRQKQGREERRRKRDECGLATKKAEASLPTGQKSRENAINDKVVVGELAEVLPMTTEAGRRNKRRTLIAVSPYIELTEEESNTTVMMNVFGRTFNRWYFKWKRFTGSLTAVTVIWGVCGAAIYQLLYHNFWLPNQIVLALSYAFVGFWFMLQFLCYINASVVKRCLKCYEAFHLILETLFFSASYWGLNCFRWSDVVFPYGYVISTCPYIFYDSFHVSVRQKTRPFLLAGAGLILIIWTCLYSRIRGDEMCFYRVDLRHGLLLPEEISAIEAAERNNTVASSPTTTSSYPFNWGFSLFDFCLNRGITVLLSMMKIIYSSYRHPKDCAILKSRLRTIESYTTPEKGHSNSQEKSNQHPITALPFVSSSPSSVFPEQGGTLSPSQGVIEEDL